MNKEENQIENGEIEIFNEKNLMWKGEIKNGTEKVHLIGKTKVKIFGNVQVYINNFKILNKKFKIIKKGEIAEGKSLN